jgi:hypothetical protein
MKRLERRALNSRAACKVNVCYARVEFHFVLHKQTRSFEPRFVSGNAGTISRIRSQSVLPPLLSAFRNRSRPCPPGNIKLIKKAESIDWKCSRQQTHFSSDKLQSVTLDMAFHVIRYIAHSLYNKEGSQAIT